VSLNSWRTVPGSMTTAPSVGAELLAEVRVYDPHLVRRPPEGRLGLEHAVRHPSSLLRTPAPPAGVAVLRAEETRRTAAMSV
jgi:hypothetical protein